MSGQSEAERLIAEERRIRHKTIPQLKSYLGEHWPSRVAEIVRDADAAVDALQAQVEQGAGELDRARKALMDCVRREAALREAIEEYSLWRPGEKGHAEAHRKLLSALSEQSESDSG